MAKWGEGDPRWIVEERPDATNVNNWHWSEKNASAWSKDKLKDLFVHLDLVVPELGSVKLSDIKCEGEATANNRKGKLIFFYEWVIKCNWIGTTSDESKTTSEGTIEIPNLSEENEPHEIDVNVLIKNGGENAEKFKDYLRKQGTEEIRKQIVMYLEALRKEYSADLILPTKGKTVNNTNVKSVTKISSSSSKCPVKDATINIKGLDIGCKIETSNINLSQIFKCRVEEVYNALTVKEMVIAFTRNDVKLDVKKGGKFELFGGSIEGEFVEIVPQLQLVQRWRFKTWPSGHYSTVVLDFIDKSDCTEIRLCQTGVPSNDIERTKQGWQNYYWESMKRTFGFGAVLI